MMKMLTLIVAMLAAPAFGDNIGKDCWHPCGGKGGPCPRFCGDEAACCRADWKGKGWDPEICNKVISDPVRTNRHECAKIETKPPRCEDSCEGNKSPWKEKCAFTDNSCSACSACTPRCEDSCKTDGRSWEEKCNLDDNACSACSECKPDFDPDCSKYPLAKEQRCAEYSKGQYCWKQDAPFCSKFGWCGDGLPWQTHEGKFDAARVPWPCNPESQEDKDAKNCMVTSDCGNLEFCKAGKCEVCTDQCSYESENVAQYYVKSQEECQESCTGSDATAWTFFNYPGWAHTCFCRKDVSSPTYISRATSGIFKQCKQCMCTKADGGECVAADADREGKYLFGPDDMNCWVENGKYSFREKGVCPKPKECTKDDKCWPGRCATEDDHTCRCRKDNTPCPDKDCSKCPDDEEEEEEECVAPQASFDLGSAQQLADWEVKMGHCANALFIDMMVIAQQREGSGLPSADQFNENQAAWKYTFRDYFWMEAKLSMPGQAKDAYNNLSEQERWDMRSAFAAATGHKANSADCVGIDLPKSLEEILKDLGQITDSLGGSCQDNQIDGNSLRTFSFGFEHSRQPEPELSYLGGQQEAMNEYFKSAKTPADWSWRRRMQIVDDQGPCGSCWAFAGYTVLDFHLNKVRAHSRENCKTMAPYDGSHLWDDWTTLVYKADHSIARYARQGQFECGDPQNRVGHDASPSGSKIRACTGGNAFYIYRDLLEDNWKKSKRETLHTNEKTYRKYYKVTTDKNRSNDPDDGKFMYSWNQNDLQKCRVTKGQTKYDRMGDGGALANHLNLFTFKLSNNQDFTRALLYHVGPVDTAINGYMMPSNSDPNFMVAGNACHSDVINRCKNRRTSCQRTINHQVTLMQYGTMKEGKYAGKRYWTILNSWGDNWGDRGYLKFETNDHGDFTYSSGGRSYSGCSSMESWFGSQTLIHHQPDDKNDIIYINHDPAKMCAEFDAAGKCTKCRSGFTMKAGQCEEPTEISEDYSAQCEAVVPGSEQYRYVFSSKAVQKVECEADGIEPMELRCDGRGAYQMATLPRDECNPAIVSCDYRNEEFRNYCACQKFDNGKGKDKKCRECRKGYKAHNGYCKKIDEEEEDDEECTCKNGLPDKNGCSKKGENRCNSCNPGYRLLENKSCAANKCTCSNGSPIEQSKCTADGQEKCGKCNVGFHLEGNACMPNECKCPNGTPATGDQCPKDGETKCAGCDEGYSKKDGQCKANECQCANGTPVPTGDCPKDGQNKCAQCDEGFLKEGDHCKKDMSCKCNNGNPVDEQCPDEKDKCSACYRGYTLFESRCIMNQCTCSNGTPVVQQQCDANGKEKCQKCDAHFHLEDGHCKPNQCICPNGIPVPSHQCPKHGALKCEICKPGFESHGDECRAPGSCKKHEHEEDNECVANKCTCENGTASAGTMCRALPMKCVDRCQGQDHCQVFGSKPVNNCFKCNPGYKPEWSVDPITNHPNGLIECQPICKQGQTKVNGSCVDNRCSCQNGEAREGSFCVAQEHVCEGDNCAKLGDGPRNHCMKCDDGFKLEWDVNSSGAKNGLLKCTKKKCPKHQHLEGSACIDNKCTCDNGQVAATCAPKMEYCVDQCSNHCHVFGEMPMEHCGSCKDGYKKVYQADPVTGKPNGLISCVASVQGSKQIHDEDESEGWGSYFGLMETQTPETLLTPDNFEEPDMDISADGMHLVLP